MSLSTLLTSIADKVTDPEEESFTLYTTPIPSQNLGMISPQSSSIDVSIAGNEYTVEQSPGVLNSGRAGGTTGAVTWKITPLLSTWLTHPNNPLRGAASLINDTTTIVELGTGISGLLALSLAPMVKSYLATDQGYVRRLLRRNIAENVGTAFRQRNRTQQGRKTKSKSKPSRPSPGESTDGGGGDNDTNIESSNISFSTLDWEVHSPSATLPYPPPSSSEEEERTGEKSTGFDILLSADCIYNEALVSPFIRTCADIARLRPSLSSLSLSGGGDGPFERGMRPTVCVIAQQLRSSEVFEGWIREVMREFEVWRVRDEGLQFGISGGEWRGYVVHLLVLK